MLVALLVLASAGVPGSDAGLGTAGSCVNLVASVRTNESDYAPGQPVIITVTQANNGPACSTPTPPCGLPSAASAYNSAGEPVWEYGTGKIEGQITCPPAAVASMTWSAHYSKTQRLRWSQDRCTQGIGIPGHPNPNCPGTQVPAGTYRIVGGNGPSASVTVTLSG
jgi:hypothetical protein